MAQVDPDDDSIRRFVVQHYRFDPRRRQYRRVPVAAFDNLEEYEAGVASLAADIERRRLAREHVDRYERATGTGYGAGDRDEAAYGRFLQRAFAHGVDVRPLLAERGAPKNMTFLFLNEDDTDTDSTQPKGD